jgi:LysR family glycine cleavage system transcriptional activator
MAKLRFPAWSALKAFEAAARHQSVKEAGDELHVTPAAVSRHIRQLERQLGCRLFERRHRKIVLNAKGEILLSGVSKGFEHIQLVIAQLSGIPLSSSLVISVDPDFASLWLVPRLAEFYPLVPGTLVEIRSERVLNSFDDRIDCAIQYTDANRRIANGERLFRSRLFPVHARGPTELPPLRSPEDLRHHVLLHDRSIVEWEEYLRRSPTAVGVNVRSGLIFSDTAHCMDAAVRGQGIAIGDDFLAAIHLAEGRLVKPFDSAFYSRNAYYFIVTKRDTRHPAVTAFRNWLIQSIHRVRATTPRSRRSGKG